jgi:hypothetical protein
MKKRVYNKTFGKIVRTLGFLLLLIGSVYFFSKIVTHTSYRTLALISALTPYGEMIEAQLAIVPFLSSGYALFAVAFGIILIVWAIRQGLIVRLVITGTLILGTLLTILNVTGLFVPVAVTIDASIYNIIAMGDVLLQPLLDISPYIAPGLFLASAFLFWVVLAYKKPKRFSLFLLRVGATLLFLAMAMTALPTILSATLFTQPLYLTGSIVLYTLSYTLFAVGSVFGVAGFLRK